MNLAMKTILVATDFTGASDLAVQYARTLATRFGAVVHVLHVVPDVFPVGSEVYAPELPQFREALVRDAWRRLDDVLKLLVGIDATCDVRIGQPARNIIAAAEEKAADLIVMGTHGRGRVGNFVIGSVAQRVVHTANCPVMMVRETSVPAVIDDKPEVAALVYK